MIQIKALNENGSSNDEFESTSDNQQLFNTETQEENLQAKYTLFLQLMSKNKKGDAKEVLTKLFDLIKDLDEEQASPVQKNIKYLTFRNLGDLFPDKIDFYLEALSIDNKDINLWIKTARRAFLDLNDIVLARNCLEVAYNLNSKNWIIIDLLLDCYFILNDFSNCINLCLNSIKLDQGYLKAHVLLNEINKYQIKKYEINNKIIKQESVKVNEIINYLNLKKSKRKNFLDKKEELYLNVKKNNKLQLKICLNKTSLNQIGINLVKLYGDIKEKNFDLNSIIEIIKNDNDNESEESTSNEEKSKNVQSNIFSNKDNSQGNSHSKTSSQSFPFEFIDKRRSSRVQRIQSKTKDLDDVTIFERISSLFIKLSLNSNKKLVKNAEQKQEKSSFTSQDEKNLINQFIQRCENLESCTIIELFKIFLYINSSNLKNLSIPNIYKEIYLIYRCHNILPQFLDIKINENFSSEELWCILSGNELKYNSSEVYFLADVSFFFEKIFSKEEYINFIIRLLILKGINESNLTYLETAKLKLEKEPDFIFHNSNGDKITSNFIKSLICSQSLNNLEKLLEEENYDKFFEILTSEIQLSENDYKIICKAIIRSEFYEKGIEILSNRETLPNYCFDTIINCYKKIHDLDINIKFVEKILDLAKNQYTVQTWVILLSILLAAPKNMVKQEDILTFIDLSHQYLGNKSRCNAHNGEYLLMVLDYLINVCTMNSDDLIWQCFYCLFGYSKRNYVFQNHCNTYIKMNWTNCLHFYNYLKPKEMPEFDSLYKNNSINSEIKDVLIQIVELIPCNMHPKEYLPLLNDYLNDGKALPRSRNFLPHIITQDIFYLLADYYFKNKEFDKAIQNYQYDLCTNHHRFDSWAAFALALNSQVDELILNDTSDYYNPKLIYASTVKAVRCYSNALRLDKKNTKIWIEFGNFVYNIGSYASKIKKTLIYFDLHNQEKSQIKVEKLDQMIKDMFDHTKYCFQNSLTTDYNEEMWLHYYVLGKMKEKKSILKALKNYKLADICLYLSGANYPKKINYSQTSLSIEALEVHYRLHASSLKAILTKNLSLKTLSKIKFYLFSALRSPFVQMHQKNKLSDQNSAVSEFEKSNSVLNFLSDLIEVTVDQVDNRENDAKKTIINLCLFGLKRCIIRFPNHYRSFYRLAHYYFAIGNYQQAKIILMDSFEDIDLLTGKYTTILGLFNERKSNNFFNGIWRIPVDDVERPGSFSIHMYKCIYLLIQVYTGLGDYNFLISTLVISLSRTPDVNKKYLRDCERLGLAKKAFDNSCMLMLQQLIIQPNVEAKRDKLLEINRLLDRLVKMNLFVQKSSEFLLQCTKHVNSLMK